jgi:hypothetical protein
MDSALIDFVSPNIEPFCLTPCRKHSVSGDDEIDGTAGGEL